MRPTQPLPPTAHDLATHWKVAQNITFLNHGSFGACPDIVLDAQTELRARMERNPVQFLDRELEPLLDAARAELGAFLGAQPQDLAWIANATAGVNSVLRSMAFAPGDEILVTDHGYNACRNAVEYVAQTTGARVVVAQVPFPLASGRQVVDAVTAAVTSRTRLALIDHVTSPTGLVWPIQPIIDTLQGQGIDVLVDGAHGPGMVVLDLDRLGAAYYTGNCHKWTCGPKGAAFLHVRRDRQLHLHPLSISHGFQGPTRGRPRFWMEFDWTGTGDPTAALCVPVALRFLAGLRPGGWPAWLAANRALVLQARDLLCSAWAVAPPCPDELIGSLATVALPGHLHDSDDATELPPDPLAAHLWQVHRIEVPVMTWGGHRWLRVSAQGYNHLPQYAKLADAVLGFAQAAPPVG
jgi:isopenicillin-N epimerase